MSMLMERPREGRDSQDREDRRASCSSLSEGEEKASQEVRVRTKREEREREKALQKRIGELGTQINRLERRIALLKAENDGLKRKQDDQKPLEEKLRSLKKRNVELAAIARRLEEKARNLQQDTARKGTLISQDESGTDVELVKRTFARQRAKDLSEHAKVMLAKDREIEELRNRCQQLIDQLSNGETMAPQNASQFEEKEELVTIIKQAAKERLLLEQQLSHSHHRETPDVERHLKEAQQNQKLQAKEKYLQELEAANQILHEETHKLEQALRNSGHLEQELKDKTSEVHSLSKELANTTQQKLQLEQQLRASVAENRQLSEKVTELLAEIQELEKITEECNTLKATLASAQKDREAAEEEVKILNLRVHSLENVVRDLQDSAEHASRLEDEHKTVLQQLQQTQAQLDQIQQINSHVESKHAQTISTLNEQVLELEQKRQADEKRREELAIEVLRLQREAVEQQTVLAEARVLREKLGDDSLLIPVQNSPNNRKLTSLSSEHLTGEGDHDLNQGVLVRTAEMESKASNPHDHSLDESLLAYWALKGQVYIAKYNYDPFELSPNENPEAELPLTAGDYVLVSGEMDEDGFFEGELISGRHGLVPSNFIEKVEEHDIQDFLAALFQAGLGDSGLVNNNNNNTPSSVPPHVPTLPTTAALASTTNTPLASINYKNSNHSNYPSGENKEKKIKTRTASVENQEEFLSDLEDIVEIDEDNASNNSKTLANGSATKTLPPCPRSLSLDRQLTNSLLVSWRGPDITQGLEVESYHVLVDGQLKVSVGSSERTKALIEGVNSSGVHRVCVRCVSNRGQSKDAQCTMLVGKDVYPVPSDLKISHLTPTSALLSWLPGNSNYQHAVIVNGKEVRVVKPGVFRQMLTGLIPETAHKVTLIAKSISGTLNEEKSRKWVENVSASIEFHTPAAGALDPPLNVQVESGPREGTLLLTWLPVTINASGACNGAVVTGYHIIADGKKVKFVPGPTSDHAVLGLSDFKGTPPITLSVRTASATGESSDSQLLLLPQQLIKEMAESSQRSLAKPVITKTRKSLGGEEQKGHDTDEEIEEAFRAHNPSQRLNALSQLCSESSSSELSDIPEVEEDLIGWQDSRLNEVSSDLTNQANFSYQVGKVSPQPAPRKLVPSITETKPKEFHAQKPTGSVTKVVASSPSRMVPAIEIIRDSSIEHFTSADEDAEERITPSTHSTPTNAPVRARILANSPATTLTGISSTSPVDAQNPSAFRQVDHSRHKETSANLVSQNGADGQFRTHPPTNYPIKSQPPDLNPKQTKQSPSPKQRSSKTQSPRSEGAQSPKHRKHAAGFSSSPISPLDDAGDTDSISGEINQVIDANTVRLFIALFDYDPTTMSPNVDSIDEELPFREGQILKVFGDKDADGFYKGENLGRVGFIPCNMVSEVKIDDAEILEQLLQESAERLEPVSRVSSTHAPVDDQSSDTQLTPNGVVSVPRENSGVRKMIAMYDYDPQELSPNVDAEMELSFKTGDTVLIYGDMDEDGFYTGEVNGQQGLVPSNFLQPAPSSDDDGIESASLGSEPRSRSGESIDAALNALARTDNTTNVPKVEEKLRGSGDTTSSNKQHVNINTSEIKLESTRQGAASPTDDEKPKKKGGFLNKSKNIFKKFTR